MNNNNKPYAYLWRILSVFCLLVGAIFVAQLGNTYYQYHTNLVEAEQFTKNAAAHAAELIEAKGAEHNRLKVATQALYDLELGDKGYGYVINDRGAIIAHPVESLIGQSIQQHLGNLKATNYLSLIEQSLHQRVVFGKIVDPETKHVAWIATHPIADSDLNVVIVTDKTAKLEGAFAALEVDIHAAIFIGTLFFLLLTLLLMHYFHNRRTLLFGLSVISMAILLTAAGVYAKVQLDTVRKDTVPIYSAHEVHHYLNNHPVIKRQKTKPVEIPMGVFIQSINFPMELTSGLTMYLWHKYPKNSPVNLTPGYVLPQQNNEQFSRLEYQLSEKNYELYGWHVITQFRHVYHARLYPFDSQVLSLELESKNFYKETVPVPDFTAYELMAPESLPGVDNEIVLKRWWLKRSYFGYRPNNVNTDYGIEQYAHNHEWPVLTFNILMKRKLIEPFFTYFLPLIVVALLTFINLIVTKKKESVYSELGFSASMLFVLSIAHIALRDDIQSPVITFVEYCYILMYLLIALVTVNNIALIREVKLKLLTYRKNLIPKLLYWPLMAFLIFVTTVAMFQL